MKCPRDGTELAKVSILGLELDKCHKCDGLWLDHGELERLRDAEVPNVEELIERKYGDPEFQPDTTDAYMRCPRCVDARLARQHYTYINPVAIDRCERCMGIWLDDTELNAITEEKRQLNEQDQQVKGFLAALVQKFRGKE